MAREESTPRTLTVPSDYAGRLDAYLVQELPGHSRSVIQAWIKAGRIRVNGELQKTGYTLHSGDRVDIEGLPPRNDRLLELEPVDLSLDILYEDDEVLVLNKPAGLVMHPGAGTREQVTLVAGVLAHIGREAGQMPGEPLRPGIVHRLDKETSGVLVVAKTTRAHRHLSTQFKNKTNLREYVALLEGAMAGSEQTVESYLHRDPKHRIRFASLSLEDYARKVEDGADLVSYRFAKTHFFRKKIYGQKLTVALMRLETGRTHQIRVHARSLGLPVWGDKLYGATLRLPAGFPAELRQALQDVPRLLLHARRLGFEHPLTGQKLAFEAPLPPDFRSVLELLEKHSQI
ncbi:MAG: RluA family pseudouridine synthase [Oligoflexus sp.]